MISKQHLADQLYCVKSKLKEISSITETIQRRFVDRLALGLSLLASKGKKLA